MVVGKKKFNANSSTVKTKSTSYFAAGKLTWITGLNAGIQCDVKNSTTTTGLIELQQEMRYSIQNGDQFSIVAGCDRRFETCTGKFNNGINYRGFPHIRGSDYLQRSVQR